MDEARVAAICWDREFFRDGDVLAVHTVRPLSDVVKPWRWLSDVLTWRIQRTTRSRWNHVGMLFWRRYKDCLEEPAREQWVVREALWRVSETPLADYLKAGGRYELGGFRHPSLCADAPASVLPSAPGFGPMTGDWPLDLRQASARASLEAWTRAQLGEAYDWPRLLQLRALQLVLGYREVGGVSIVKAATADDRSWICSAFTICAFAAVRLGLRLGKYASPADVVKPLRRVWECRKNVEVWY